MRIKKAAVLVITVILLLSITGCSVSESTIHTTAELTEAVDSTLSEETAATDHTATEFTSTEPVNTEEETAVTNNSNQIQLNINGHTLTATLADNSSADALKELLAEGPVTVSMNDYGNMEKVGDLGTSLPSNDEQITTEAGDLILYMGNMFVIYYAPNSWNFTRLGKINDITADELQAILGDGGVEVMLSC